MCAGGSDGSGGGGRGADGGGSGDHRGGRGGGGKGTSAPSGRSSWQSCHGVERILRFTWEREHRRGIMQEIIAATRQLQKSVKAGQSEALVAAAQASLDAARERMRAAKDETFLLDADYVAEMRRRFEAEEGLDIFSRYECRLLFPLVRTKKRIGAALSLHPRVGEGSGLGRLNEDILRFILDMALPFVDAGRNLHCQSSLTRY